MATEIIAGVITILCLTIVCGAVLAGMAMSFTNDHLKSENKRLEQELQRRSLR